MNINLTLLSQAVVFAVFIWFTARFVWPPLLRATENRQKTIAEGLAAGERGRHELELASQRSADVVREAKQRAVDIVAQAEKRAAEIVDEAKTAAREEGDRILVGARAEVEQEVFRAREALRQQVADLALAGAAKILHREVDAKAHADLLASIKTEL
ncbi:F0F1 ATP synthase subunit B [Nitrosovibrio sp. Nv17]|uniref:F0F1 ATP synthase subunit B n=1 Tax=Nitrosovibrio sp. Nv17 TaxID=1855339 RepID=UPI00090871D4|nr:F0F1 ATP synthase subunit B [Nitrosovibrio sp. Nv17]SFW29754.1 F-type H+-transporting ATPase subunit b [Nitrosovibrio sp. Nv17]